MVEFKPHSYQQYAIEALLNNERYGLLLDMGLGKTVSTLSAINLLKYSALEVDKVLIIAPKRVAQDTWSREVDKWEHLKHLRISKVLGSEPQRRKALMKDADIYVINRENVKWLVERFERSEWPFDMIVVDELSSFKSPSSQRFKALKKVAPLSKRFVGLTGTPAPNGLLDLWSQIYLIDFGERLGRTFSAYRNRYFYKNDYEYNYKPFEQTEARVFELIDDIVVSMKSEDHIELPERIDSIQAVTLSRAEREVYEEMERNMILNFIEDKLIKFKEDNPEEELPTAEQIIAKNAAVLSNKLLQLSNGSVYTEEQGVKVIHDKKLERLEEIIEEANSSPVLVFYSFKHDRDRILERFKNAESIDAPDAIARWNSGEVPVMVAHPASAGHGLNLQDGGHIIVWYGLTWSLELYQQANARLHRQGQRHATIIHHIVAEGSIDVDKILPALQGKKQMQDALIEAVKAKMEAYNE